MPSIVVDLHGPFAEAVQRVIEEKKLQVVAVTRSEDDHMTVWIYGPGKAIGILSTYVDPQSTLLTQENRAQEFIYWLGGRLSYGKPYRIPY